MMIERERATRRLYSTTDKNKTESLLVRMQIFFCDDVLLLKVGKLPGFWSAKLKKKFLQIVFCLKIGYFVSSGKFSKQKS